MANALKKAMIFAGLADEEGLEEGYPEQPRAKQRRSETRDEPQASVTPLHRPAVVRKSASHAVNEILTAHPTAFGEAKAIGEIFRDGIPVIMNLTKTSDSDARRLIDFASGLTSGLNGRIERITNKVFLLSPESITVSHGKEAEITEG